MLTQEDLHQFRQRLESERDAIRSRMAERSRDSRETVREEPASVTRATSRPV